MPPSPSDIVEVLPPSTFWIFFWLAVAGAFGGLCGALSTRSYAEVIAEGIGAFKGWWRFFGCISWGMIEGAAAALAVSVLLAYDDKFKCLIATDWSERIKVQVLLCSVAIVAGFSGVRILRRMSANLEQKVEEATKESGEAKSEADSAKREVGKLADELSKTKSLGTDLALGMYTASIALSKRNTDGFRSEALSALTKLERVKDFFRDQPMLWLLMGRLYRWLGEWEKATSILEEFLAPRACSSKEEATLLYNLACYYNRRGILEKNDSFKAKALSTLNEAIAIVPSYKEEAKADPDGDFEGLDF